MKKSLNELDKLVLLFVSLLKELKIKYVITSGYVAILFGRSRVTEDVDIVVEDMTEERFEKLWKASQKKFYCINTSDMGEAFHDFFSKRIPLRFARKGSFIPNIELKKIKNEVDRITLEKRTKIRVNDFYIYISPLEIQIAYKMFLGSLKDLEDAKFLFELFKDKLDKGMLSQFLKVLRVDRKVVKEWLGKLE